MTRSNPTIAIRRFGIGPASADRDAAESNPKGWLLSQLETTYDKPKEFKGFMSVAELRAVHHYRYGELNPQLRRDRRKAAQAGEDDRAADLSADIQEMLGGYVTWVRENFMLEFGARTNVAVTTPMPFQERLGRFWANHLVVPGLKQSANLLAGAYEREVIRPHVNGRFSDMLTACVKNPAMQVFLDNYISVGPNSKYGKKYGKGLNENLGREILELHTMGVDGGYTQQDVIELSLGITGWTTWPSAPEDPEWADVSSDGIDSGAFRFFADRHEPGPRTMLGVKYDQPGIEQGEAMLQDLARRPETAHFLALKMARHFVSDTPPEALVKRMAETFQANDTDLAAMTRVLIDSEEAWGNYGSKLEQPELYVISVLRALNAPVAGGKVPPQTPYKFGNYDFRKHAWAYLYDDEYGIVRGKTEKDFPSDYAQNGIEIAALYRDIQGMGQGPLKAPGPQGWYDRSDDWNGADSLIKRVDFAMAMANQHAANMKDPRLFARMVFGDELSETLQRTVSGAATKEQGIGLALSSPQFQRR